MAYFLPSNYTAPKSAGAYMKISDGENRIRILTAPVLGWEDWLDKKPVRYHFDAKPAKSIDPLKPIKHFWAFIVWNHLEEKIQILQITQATIRNTIEALVKDQDWGAPYFYDIKIIKSGEGKNTEYAVTPLPHKPVEDRIKKAFYNTPCNLESLFTGDDPFALGNTPTKGMFDVEHVETDRGNDLKERLGRCSVEFQNSISSFCKKHNLSEDLSNLPDSVYEKIDSAITRELDDTFAIGA